jgi:adenosylhomocysteine nucleosidase
MNDFLSPPLLVLISDKAEWNAAKKILSPTKIAQTPFGEWFSVEIDHFVIPFVYGGWGKISAAASCQYAIQKWQPGTVVNLGTCGGFESLVEKAEILLITNTIVYDIVEQMADPELVLNHYRTDIDLDWFSPDSSINLRRSCIVSGDRDLNPQDIPSLAKKFGAIAGDWESASIAWVCKRNQTRCLILRGVSDIVSEHGGEAYGNIAVYIEGASLVMQKLITLFFQLIPTLVR